MDAYPDDDPDIGLPAAAAVMCMVLVLAAALGFVAGAIWTSLLIP